MPPSHPAQPTQPTLLAVPDVGTVMPDVALTGPDGSATGLHAARAARPAVVYFMRTASCPACRLHVRTLVAERLDAPVLVIAPGDATEAAEVGRRLPADGSLTAWASGTAHAAAGLGTFLGLRHSGTFLLDAAGVVRYRRTAAIPHQSLSRNELREALSTLC